MRDYNNSDTRNYNKSIIITTSKNIKKINDDKQNKLDIHNKHNNNINTNISELEDTKKEQKEEIDELQTTMKDLK